MLIHTCTIERRAGGAADAYGQPPDSWSNILVDEPCRLIDGAVGSKSREIKIGAEVVIADYKLFIADEDITEQDRVVMGAVTYEILLVENKTNGVGNHHKEMYLRTVR
jgi:hypothetical protein